MRNLGESGELKMDFETMFNRISPRLKKMAKSHNGHNCFADENDLYQEMCVYLWNNFKDGVPDGINDAYIVKGCEFYISNILRKKREKATILSLEEPVDENGGTLKDILADPGRPLDRRIDKNLAINEVENNGFVRREKEVFSLLLKGYTVREIGKRLDISHVMVVKYKKKIIKKWQKKVGYQKHSIFT